MDLSCTWATRKASIHPVSCCLRLCLNSFCVLVHAQDILCPDLPIYSVVSNKRLYYSHGLSIADGVYCRGHCRFSSLQEASWALCLYNILLSSAIHKQRCLPTGLACKRSIAIPIGRLCPELYMQIYVPKLQIMHHSMSVALSFLARAAAATNCNQPAQQHFLLGVNSKTAPQTCASEQA